MLVWQLTILLQRDEVVLVPLRAVVAGDRMRAAVRLQRRPSDRRDEQHSGGMHREFNQKRPRRMSPSFPFIPQ